MEEEIWKDIPGFEGIYQASTLGRIKSLERKIKHWKGGYSVLKESILSERKSKGYVSVVLYKNGKNKNIDIHRLIAITFIPNPNDKPEVNHKDFIKTNNRVSNLEWTTSEENIKHAVENGLITSRKGENNNFSKLKEKDVLIIRDVLKKNPKINKQVIINLFSVSKSTINQIRSRRIWSHI